MRPHFKVDRREDIPHAISILQQAGQGHSVPLLQAAYHGRLAYLPVSRHTTARFFKLWAARVQLPAVAVVGDDDEALVDGPASWPLAERILRWARYVVVHGGAGQVDHYQHVVGLAHLAGRVVMVECSSAKVAAWELAAQRWARGAGGLVLKPPPGQAHPSLNRAVMQ